MKVTIYRRDFSALAVQPGVEFKVERYSRNVIGGPKRATISATGDYAELWNLLNHFRAPVEIYTDRGERVWWGYISAVEPDVNVGFGADLATMYNRIAVGYTNQNVRFTTQWSENADSVSAYGQKEILLSKTDSNLADALALRDTALAERATPSSPLKFSGSGSPKATITCSGWLETLDWKYYTNLTGKESYEITGSGGREIGEDDRPILAQSFQIAATTAWNATSIWIRPWKQGDTIPTDNLVVSLCSDAAGVPGTVLASGSLAAADIGLQAEWLEVVLSAAVTLNPATTYWIKINRSGAVAESNYFMVDTNFNAGYERGAILLYNTNLAAWTSESLWGDLLFQIIGNTETSGQIGTLITNCGQFFGGTILEAASGINANPYRDGDTGALYELLKILAVGTSNKRRLLCEVTPNRYLRVYEEPAKPTVAAQSYALDRSRQLMTQYLTPINPELCTVGVWCHLVDVIPATVDFSLVADPSLFFIDEAEYDMASGEYNILLTRNQDNALDIGGTVQG